MRLRYSFKVLLVVFTLISVCIGTFAARLHGARRQRELVASLRAADVAVWYKYNMCNGVPVMNMPDPLGTGPQDGVSDVSRWKVWLGRQFGRDFVFDVGHVDAFQPISADLISRLPDLRGMDQLHLDVHRPFADDAWRALLVCRQIIRLSVKRDQIGEARPLTGLSALDQLEYLTVDGGEVSVEDAREIAGLCDLRELTLSLVSVTDESLRSLVALKKLDRFSLKHRGTGPNQTAAGVAMLAQLPSLRAIELRNSNKTAGDWLILRSLRSKMCLSPLRRRFC